MKDYGPTVREAVATEKRKPRKRKAPSKPELEAAMFSVAEVCKRRKLNPAEMILDAIQSDDLTLKERAEFSKVLLEYVEPKKRAIEHSGSVDIGLPELLAQAEEEWRARRG